MELLCKFHLQALFFISLLLYRNSLTGVAAEVSTAPSPSPELSPASSPAPTTYSESLTEPPISISFAPSNSPRFNSLGSLISLTEVLGETTIPKDVTKACKSTQYQSECEASIISLNHNNTQHYDSLSLMVLSTQALVLAIEGAMESISKPDQIETGDVDESVHEVCLEMYETSIDQLKGVVDAVSRNKKDDADTKLSSVVTNIDTCDETINEMGADASLFATANKVLGKMASNTLALANSALGLNSNDAEE